RWEDYLSQSGINSGGATTLLGDLYMVLGLSTVFAGMMCLGVFWRMIYQYYLLSRTAPFRQILLALSFPLIFLTVAQGIQSFIFYFLVFITPGVSCFHYASKVKAGERGGYLWERYSSHGEAG